MIFKLLIIAGLSACSFFISRQDLRHRLVSAWLVAAYMLACIGYTCLEYGFAGLLENTISVVLYVLLCFSVLTLYYYLKEKRLSNIIDSRIGLADVLLMLGIGITLELKLQVVFFMLAFTITAAMALFLMRRDRTIPLAAFLVWEHVLFLSALLFLERLTG